MHVRNFLIARNIARSEIDKAIDYIYKHQAMQAQAQQKPIQQLYKHQGMQAQASQQPIQQPSMQTAAPTPQYAIPQPTMPQSAISQVQPADYSSRIKNYIRAQLSSGYTIDIIRNALVRQGVDPYLLQGCINEVQGVNINIKHEVHFSGKTLFAVFFGIILLGILGFGAFKLNIFTQNNVLLDVTLDNYGHLYYPGDNINYQLNLRSTGSSQRFDVIATYLVLDAQNNIVAGGSKETLALETTLSVNKDIRLPDNIAPGSYKVRVIVDYGKPTKQATGSFDFEVVERGAGTTSGNETTAPEIPAEPAQNNTGIPETPPETPSGNQGQLPAFTPQQTFGETLAIIRQQAAANPVGVAGSCAKFASQEQKDICYSTVAVASGQIAYCDRISIAKYKDDCLFSFTFAGDRKAFMCDKMQDNTTKAYCVQLKVLSQIEQYVRENRTGEEGFMELNKQLKPNIFDLGNPPVPEYVQQYREHSTYSLESLTVVIENNEPNGSAG